MISGTGKNELYVLFWGQPFTTYLLDIYFCCSSATARDRMAHASFPEEGQCVTPDGEDMVECRILSTLCPQYMVQGAGHRVNINHV